MDSELFVLLQNACKEGKIKCFDTRENTLQFSSLFFFLITIHFTTVIPDIQSFHIDMNYIIDSIMWSKYEMLVLNIYFALNLLQIGMKRTTLRPRHMHFRMVMPDLFYHWSYSIYVQLLYHSLA
jgi:hypothetical protein